MKKNRLMQVDQTLVSICEVENEDYISITDMIKAKDGEFFISDWLRNRNTIEFLGVWESLNNPSFNYGEFAIIKSQAGLNSYKISVKEWTEKTKSIGLCAKAGRYGGTYAHKDIAFEFGTWISPYFKLYLIKEFQRLKEIEGKEIEWDYRRTLAATNYRIHTDAVKEHLIPFAHLKNKPDAFVYADEAELINFALFGITSKQWRKAYPEETNLCKTLRDCADSNTLIVLSNLESLNAVLIKDGMSKQDRLSKLQATALSQLESLEKLNKDYSNIESPNKRKGKIGDLNPQIESSFTFGQALKKISKAGKPKSKGDENE